MRNIFLRLALVAALAMPLLASCDDDDENTGTDADPDAETVQFKIVPLTFDRFLSAGDVIVAADSSYITVSKYYLDAIGQEICDSDRVVIWRAASELPFAKKVTGVSEATSNRIKVDLAYVDYAEVIPDGDYELSSDIYCNTDKPRRTNDGGFNDDYYTEEPSSSGITIYHPVAVICEPASATNDDGSVHIKSVVDELPSVLVEEMYMSNFVVDKRRLLEYTNTFENVYMPGFESDDDDDDNLPAVQIGFSSVTASVYGGFYLELSSKWFKIKKFKATVNAGIGLEGQFVLGIGGSLSPDEDIEWVLGTLSNFWCVYWIGVIPVPVSCNSRLVAEVMPSATGSFGLTSDFEVKASAEAGAQYVKGDGWSGIWNPETKFDFETPKLSNIQGKAYCTFGLFMKTEAKLYSAAGPVVRFGPSLNTSIEGQYDIASKEGSASASVDLELGGSIGAELKIWKWKIADWTTSFALWKWNLWSWSTDD